jgi:hypothetical protein
VILDDGRELREEKNIMTAIHTIMHDFTKNQNEETTSSATELGESSSERTITWPLDNLKPIVLERYEPHRYDPRAGRPLSLPPKPKRKRKAVTQDKCIVVRCTQDLFDRVQSASDLSGMNASKWVRRAVERALSGVDDGLEVGHS